MFESMSNAPPSSDRPVWLYVPISQASEYIALRRSGLGRIKAAVLRTCDRLAWKLLRSHAFHYEAWRRTEYTNRGDIAIREAIRQLLEARLGGERRFVELDWGSLDEAALARIHAGAGLFVICGGGYVSSDARTGALSRRMDDVAMLARIECPVIAFGIGYNLLLDAPRADMAQSVPPETTQKLSTLVAASDLIGVRDGELQRMLHEISGATIALIGDPALFLEPAETAPLSQARPGVMRIGLNFALHGPLSAAIFKAHFEDYARFLDRVQRTHAATFHYFVHCETERIAIALLRRRGVRVEVVDRPPRDLIAGYAQMDFVICQMLHSSILATNAGVPSMNIGYDRKNASFYELMGLPQLCIAHEDITQERLWALFTMLIGQKAEFAAQIGRRKAELRKDLDAFVGEVARLSAPDARVSSFVAEPGR
jgi:polysaccharide pyruvyl transferase WcaK-like protein